MKTCSKCGKTKSKDNFRPKSRICAECHKLKCKEYYQKHKEEMQEQARNYHIEHREQRIAYSKEYRNKNGDKAVARYDPNKIKVCSKCGFEGKASEFRKGRYICLNCHRASCITWRQNNLEYARTKRRTEYAEDPEKYREVQRQHRKTPAGKATMKKACFKRKALGYEPLNKWFEGCDAHHLRYAATNKEQDNNLVVHVPRKLHKSIPHNGTTGKNMKDINIACLEWYLKETPVEDQNPKAKQLYWNYCTLPEPEWSRDK